MLPWYINPFSKGLRGWCEGWGGGGTGEGEGSGEATFKGKNLLLGESKLFPLNVPVAPL